jgi:hypothetical protein
MCYQIYHICKYCGNQYECTLPEYVCPTINFDENEQMCPACEKQEAEDFRKAVEKNAVPEDKVISIDDWEKSK